MGMFRKHLLATVLVGISATGWARVNSLEPWAPGFDANVSSQKWNHAVFAHVANSGAYGTDTTGLGYSLTTPYGKNWELAGTWGIKTLDSDGVYDDSGPTDLTFGFKRKLPKEWMGKLIKGVGEFGVSIPTGDPDDGIGAGGFGFFGNAGVTAPLRAVRGYAQLGLKVYTEGSNTRWGNTLSYSAGGMYSLGSEWMVSGDIRVLTHAKDKIDGVTMPDAVQEAYLAPGGVWRPADLPFETQGLILIGLTGDSYDFGLQAGVRF
jgi:hypothetical protein